MPNQGKLLKTLTYLGLRFVKSLPWFVIETHGSKISISFYLFIAILCEKYRVCIGPNGTLCSVPFYIHVSITFNREFKLVKIHTKIAS